jgi:hypothetical protein
MKISRHYSDDHLNHDTFEVRVAIYEDQVRGWFLDQARILERCSDHGAFVLLLVALSYVEGHAIFYKGQDSSNQSPLFFRDAFKAIFPPISDDPEIVDQAITELYRQVRCGLFHTGMIRKKVVLDGTFSLPTHAIVDSASKTVQRVEINPHKVLDAIEDHLSRYVMRLRNPAERKLRGNFEKAWELRMRLDQVKGS